MCMEILTHLLQNNIDTISLTQLVAYNLECTNAEGDMAFKSTSYKVLTLYHIDNVLVSLCFVLVAHFPQALWTGFSWHAHTLDTVQI